MSPWTRGALAIVGASLVLAALSLLAPSAPTYDPWSWIIWGREIASGDLETTNGPSWKPLPVVFTTVFSLIGDGAAPALWLVIARAGALAGVALAGLAALRLAGPVAGAAAAAGLALAPWSVRNAALGNSEGLLVAIALGAVLAHAEGRRAWAFGLGVGAAMLRPEAWPFLGLYALWLVWRERGRLGWVAAGLATIPLLWLGPELWGSGNAFRASDRAQEPNPDSAAFAERPVLAVLGDAVGLLPWAVGAFVVLALVLVAIGRAPGRARGLAPGLAAVAAGWTLLVAVMTEAGFSGNERYLIMPVALAIVLGAAGAGWGLRALVAAPPRGLVVVAAVVAALLFAVPGAWRLPGVLERVDYQARLVDDLEAVIDRAGGPERVDACGAVHTGPFLVPAVAWQLERHIAEVSSLGVPRPPAAVFHVRTIEGAPLAPPPGRPAGARVAARQGAWRLTLDCGDGA